MQEFILTTPERLEEIIERAMQKVLPSKKEKTPEKIPDTCSVEQAIAFLQENGYKISKSKLYKLTASKVLPFRYFGRRIIFSRNELLEWVQQQTVAPSNLQQVLLNLAESARKKRKKQ